MKSRFEQFSDLIQQLPEAPVGAVLDERLLLQRQGRFSIYYAPFDWVNRNARLVVVGITPGQEQARQALNEAGRQLRAGMDTPELLRVARSTGSFAGPIRRNLITLMDHFQLNVWLGLESCAELFTEQQQLVHRTSALKYPVLRDGRNYSGSPDMLKQPMLREWLLAGFVAEVAQLPNGAIYLPLGEKVERALLWLASEGVLPAEQVLRGMPHPSGANAERIAYMLGRKPREALSSRTNPEKLDASRAQLQRQIAELLTG